MLYLNIALVIQANCIYLFIINLFIEKRGICKLQLKHPNYSEQNDVSFTMIYEIMKKISYGHLNLL